MKPINEIIGELMKPLPGEVVKTKPGAGKRPLSYIETSYAIRRANEIFGFFGWTHEILDLHLIGEEQVTNRRGGKNWRVGYLCRVRVRVHLDGVETFHDGQGFGDAEIPNRIEAHGNAAKAAESDAIKRALKQFGDQFGLCLYDDGAYLNVDHGNDAGGYQQQPPPAQNGGERPLPDLNAAPPKVREFIEGLLMGISDANDKAALEALWNANRTAIDQLGEWRPIVVRAVNRRLQEIAP